MQASLAVDSSLLLAAVHHSLHASKFAYIHRQCNEVSDCTLSLICFHSRTFVKLSYIAMVNDIEAIHREMQTHSITTHEL